MALERLKVALVPLLDELYAGRRSARALGTDDVLLGLLLERGLARALGAIVEADEDLPAARELLGDLPERVERLLEVADKLGGVGIDGLGARGHQGLELRQVLAEGRLALLEGRLVEKG